MKICKKLYGMAVILTALVLTFSLSSCCVVHDMLWENTTGTLVDSQTGRQVFTQSDSYPRQEYVDIEGLMHAKKRNKKAKKILEEY